MGPALPAPLPSYYVRAVRGGWDTENDCGFHLGWEFGAPGWGPHSPGALVHSRYQQLKAGKYDWLDVLLFNGQRIRIRRRQ